MLIRNGDKICIGHITQNDELWECDNKYYIFSNQDHLHPLWVPSYKSIVCMPINALETICSQNHLTTSRLGVVCFDSQNPTVFDSVEMQALLQKVGMLIAVLLSMYMQITELHKKSN